MAHTWLVIFRAEKQVCSIFKFTGVYEKEARRLFFN